MCDVGYHKHVLSRALVIATKNSSHRQNNINPPSCRHSVSKHFLLNPKFVVIRPETFPPQGSGDKTLVVWECREVLWQQLSFWRAHTVILCWWLWRKTVSPQSIESASLLSSGDQPLVFLATDWHCSCPCLLAHFVVASTSVLLLLHHKTAIN